jgi:hypothetical protein
LTKPSLFGGGQRKYNQFKKFQTGTTTTWSGYTNFTGKPTFNSNQQSHHQSKHLINVQPKSTISNTSKDKCTPQYMGLMSINPNDILFRQPPRKKLLSIQKAQQIYKHNQPHQNTNIHRSQSRSRSRSQSNHHRQGNELHATRPTHYNNKQPHDKNTFYRRKNTRSRSRSRDKTYRHPSNTHDKNTFYRRKNTHSRSRSRSRDKTYRYPSNTQCKTTTTSKKLIHGIILSDSMASKCRMFNVNTPDVIHIELAAESGCNCERMADWMASAEGKSKINGNSVVLFSLGTNDVAQLGVDLTLKRCEWLVEYTRRTFPGIKTIGWMALSPRWKPSRFYSGDEIANLHREFNERLYMLSKKINIDIVDAQLKIDDIRIEDGLHPTLSSGRQKFENAQRQWFARQAMDLSPQIEQHTKYTIINNNLINSQPKQQQQQPRKDTGQVQQLNSTQPFIVNHTKSEKRFHHPLLPSRQLIKFYPHKLKHPNQLFRDSLPPETVDREKVFLIANLYYQYRHFEEETKKWREYEIVASRKEIQQKRKIHFCDDERENSLHNNTIDREIPQVRTGPDSPRWVRNETFDSETHNESQDRETTKKRKLIDTSLSPVGFTVRARKNMYDAQVEGDEGDDQEQPIEDYNPLRQSTPTNHNPNQPLHSPPHVYTQRVVRRPSTTIEIESPSVTSKDIHIEKLRSFDFPIIPIECKYILGNTCNAESIKKHRIFLEKKTEQTETKLNNEMKEISREQAGIVKQYIINNIDPIVETFKKSNRKRLDNLILDQMKEQARRQIKTRCDIDELEKVRRLEEQYERTLNVHFQLRKLEKRMNLNMPPPYLNVMDKLQLRSKELDNNEIEQFTEQWNNIIRHAKKDFTSIMIFAKTAEVEKLEKRYKESLETLRECIREPFDTLIHTIKTRHDQITEKKIHFLEQKTYRTRET